MKSPLADGLASQADPTSPKVMNGWVKAIVAVLERQGADSKALLSQAGIGRSEWQNPKGSLPLNRIMKLWALAETATGDPCLGLRVASHVSPNSFQAVGLMLLSSSSLNDMLQRLHQHGHHIAGQSPIRLETRPRLLEVHLSTTALDGRPIWSVTDATASLIACVGKLLLGPGHRPQEVRLQRPPPGDEVERFARAFYQAPIVFNATHNTLVYDRLSAECALSPPDLDMLKAHEDILSRRQAKEVADCVLTQVREQLIAWLPDGEPSHIRMAQALQISARSLQRRLADAGTNYRRLLQQTRLEQAQTLLRRNNLSVGDVAYELGFGDASTFTHAFRRWTGLAPSDWRKLQG